VTAVDGRVERGARNREAIADALLACYEAGLLRPSIPEVAARAGVSTRSVHNHFADVETLRAEVAHRQAERYAHLMTPVESLDELLDARAALFEAVTPVRRAALLTVDHSPTIAANLARLDLVLRRQITSLFADLEPNTIEAIDALTSWDAWNRLRTAQGLSVAHARAVLDQAIRTLTEGSAS
jgi:AcrR family transcriptional regulator